MRINLKHIQRMTIKGKTYWYHRRTRERLPDDPDERARRVLEINSSNALRAEHTPERGSYDDLISRYRNSPEWQELAEVTRKDYQTHLDAISAAWGKLQAVDTRSKHMRAMRDGLRDTPRKANLRMSVLSRLHNFGLGIDDETFGQVNPVAVFYKGNRKLKEGDGYQPWPDNVVAAFAKAAYPELRAIVIGGALGTGQRGQDLVAMTRSHVGPTHWEFRQKKTGTWMELPHTDEFQQVVDNLPSDRLLVFVTKTGKRWGLAHLRHEVQRIMAQIGYPGYSLHGLRYKAARRLYLKGSSWEEIAAVTGHLAVRMARQYAEREEHATNAVRRISVKSADQTVKLVDPTIRKA